MLQKNWLELIKPNKMDINVTDSDGQSGIVVAEPLEGGVGLTIGKKDFSN